MPDPKFELTYDAENLLKARLDLLKRNLPEITRAAGVTELGGANGGKTIMIHGSQDIPPRVAEVLRLQGQIGALQWVLRQAGIEA